MINGVMKYKLKNCKSAIYCFVLSKRKFWKIEQHSTGEVDSLVDQI